MYMLPQHVPLKPNRNTPTAPTSVRNRHIHRTPDGRHDCHSYLRARHVMLQRPHLSMPGVLFKLETLIDLVTLFYRETIAHWLNKTFLVCCAAGANHFIHPCIYLHVFQLHWRPVRRAIRPTAWLSHITAGRRRLFSINTLPFTTPWPTH